LLSLHGRHQRRGVADRTRPHASPRGEDRVCEGSCASHTSPPSPTQVGRSRLAHVWWRISGTPEIRGEGLRVTKRSRRSAS
jgi:hypothetical protein